jgi:hypothetical protein
MKAYWGSGSIAFVILACTRWRWVISFMPWPLYPQGKSPCFPLDRRLCGPQSRSGHSGEEKNSQALPGLEPLIIQIHFNVILLSMPRPLKWSLSMRFLKQIFGYTTCCHISFFWFNHPKILDEVHQLWSSFLCNFHCIVTSPPLVPNILLSTLNVFSPQSRNKFHSYVNKDEKS